MLNWSIWSVQQDDAASARSAEHSHGQDGELAPGPSKTSEPMRLEVWDGVVIRVSDKTASVPVTSLDTAVQRAVTVPLTVR